MRATLTLVAVLVLAGFYGRKTAAYRQVGNAFPPPVAAALGAAITTALGQTLTTVPGSEQAITHILSASIFGSPSDSAHAPTPPATRYVR